MKAITVQCKDIERIKINLTTQFYFIIFTLLNKKLLLAY